MKPIFSLSIFFILVLVVSGASPIPKINSYVTDNAGVLSSNATSYLENSLRDLEKQTNGVQFVVYIENEYPKDYSLEEYTLKIAEDNKIGKKGNDNGLLLYIAIKDKKYRWETGYGVESTLNSALLGRISRAYFVPNFREGNYEKGILDAVNVTERILLNSSDADIIALKSESKSNIDPRIIIIVIIILIALFFIVREVASSSGGSKLVEKKKNVYKGAATGIFLGGFGRGGFSGGSGGGFGGFSGGGGGFGGGGGSGGW